MVLPRGLRQDWWPRGILKEYEYYEETFFLVVQLTTIRCSIALDAHRGRTLFQLDVNTVFLHGDLFEEAYMQVPEGIQNPEGKVRRLQKSLYGLK